MDIPVFPSPISARRGPPILDRLLTNDPPTGASGAARSNAVRLPLESLRQRPRQCTQDFL